MRDRYSAEGDCLADPLTRDLLHRAECLADHAMRQV